MQYFGNRGLDAEIVLDLEKNKISFDYSSLCKGNLYSSNNSTFLKDEFDNTKLKIFYLFWKSLLDSSGFVMAIYVFYFTWLSYHGYIKDKSAQFEHQALLAYYFSSLYGIVTKKHSGEIKEKTHIFEIPTNVFIEYFLDGEYKEQIKSISLKRNYVNITQFSRFEQIRQQGWILIFEFKQSPKNGSCTVKYIREPH
jgi:hypothetical protein